MKGKSKYFHDYVIELDILTYLPLQFFILQVSQFVEILQIN